MPEPLKFDVRFYPAGAVQAAVRAYDGLAQFDVREEDGQTLVTVSEPRADLADVLEDEFTNHVLFESVRAVRGTGVA